MNGHHLVGTTIQQRLIKQMLQPEKLIRTDSKKTAATEAQQTTVLKRRESVSNKRLSNKEDLTQEGNKIHIPNKCKTRNKIADQAMSTAMRRRELGQAQGAWFISTLRKLTSLHLPNSCKGN